MKTRILLVLSVVFVLLLAARLSSATAAPAADCDATAVGSMTNLSSQSIDFNCAASAPVYFGVCDSGSVPNDDLFVIEFDGATVSRNFFVGAGEMFEIGVGQSNAGSNTATLRSINNSPFPPATYAYAISSDSGVVTDYLSRFCGSDFQGVGMPAGTQCLRNVPIFTTDQAPSAGTLEFRIMFGNEESREDSILLQTWNITSGQQLNNVLTTRVPGPRYVRLYWQPDGGDWSMLTSQYWHNEWTKNDEYGVDCRYPAQPSYHTSFASAVALDDVCFDLMNGCR